MKSGVLVILKKELARFFGDRRMAVTTILLPGLLIYVMYSFMGTAMRKNFEELLPETFRVAVVSMPDSVRPLLPEEQFRVSEVPEADAETKKDEIRDGETLDALLIFPQDFDAAVAAYTPETGAAAPHVELYCNSAEKQSSAASEALTALLDAYESALSNRFDVNPGGEGYDLADEKDLTGSIFSAMLPMLLMIFMCSGCMAVAPEALAGEKERGTLATMLVTPTRRRDLALGKVLALSLIAVLSGASSTIGTILSLPKLMQLDSEGMRAAAYAASDYAALALVIFSTVLLLTALFLLISAYAKTVKEAQSMAGPLMMAVMFVGVFAMFGGGAKEGLAYYAIPLYNAVQAMVGIFSFETLWSAVGITAGTNLLLTGVAALVLTRMFNSETVMFRR